MGFLSWLRKKEKIDELLPNPVTVNGRTVNTVGQLNAAFTKQKRSNQVWDITADPNYTRFAKILRRLLTRDGQRAFYAAARDPIGGIIIRSLLKPDITEIEISNAINQLKSMRIIGL